MKKMYLDQKRLCDFMEETQDKIIAVFMLLLIGVFFAMLVIGLYSNADAEKLSDDVGISLSSSCIALLQFPESSPCPDYQMINVVFTDTTLPEISGGFELIDGLYQRNSKQLNDHYEYYRTDNQTAQWIDPPADVATRIKTIEIRPSLPEYKLKGNSTLMMLNNESDEFERFMGHSRYVTPNCMSAAITADDWLFVLGDTIQYLKHNCDPDFTNLDTITKYTKQKTFIDISESRDYQHKAWIQKIKDECLSVYGKCK